MSCALRIRVCVLLTKLLTRNQWRHRLARIAVISSDVGSECDEDTGFVDNDKAASKPNTRRMDARERMPSVKMARGKILGRRSKS
mmetsp:Transcript_4736/g.6721  ORF Transcript_4736/g.6721 Transcript_4736/m.6721 type:complete len:85 (+) Transcript_4736:1228-1482(+)